MARFADSIMSSRYARSSEFKRHRRGKDRLAPDMVATPLDAHALREIDITAEHFPQFFLHVRDVEKADPCSFRKPHHYVHIAIGAELFRPCDAPEQRKLRHLPLLAKFAESVFRYLDRDHAAAP